MNREEQKVYSEIRRYKRKYYLSSLIKGSIVTTALILGTYLLFTSLEYVARMFLWEEESFYLVLSSWQFSCWSITSSDP